MGILDPDDYGINNNGIYVWRQYLKRQLVYKRRGLSDYSKNKLTACHMHEGLIPRRMVPKSIWWHYKLFHEYNSILLLPEEHIPTPPTREWCFNYLCDIYDRDNVVAWVEGLPFKVKPYGVLEFS